MRFISIQVKVCVCVRSLILFEMHNFFFLATLVMKLDTSFVHVIKCICFFLVYFLCVFFSSSFRLLWIGRQRPSFWWYEWHVSEANINWSESFHSIEHERLNLRWLNFFQIKYTYWVLFQVESLLSLELVLLLMQLLLLLLLLLPLLLLFL